jgi:hypothetical protein
MLQKMSSVMNLNPAHVYEGSKNLGQTPNRNE